MAILDEVRISFSGDTTQLDRDVAAARTKAEELAKKPVVVPTAADPGPTYSYWRNNTETAKRSLAEVASEKAANDELDARLLKTQEERYKQNVRQRAADAYAANERRLQEISKQKHEEYLVDKAAEEKITDTVETEGTRRINRLRGLGAIFRATGLDQYGITENGINVGIQIYNQVQKANEVRAASAASSSVIAAAETETAASATVAAAAETEFAGASQVAAEGTTVTAAATTETAVAAGTVTLAFTALAAVLLPVAAAAAIFAYWTKTVRQEAEKQLKIEEDLAAATNRQLTYRKGITDELAKQIKDAERARELTDYKGDFSGNSTENLEDQRKRLKEQLDLVAPSQYNNTTRRFELSADQLSLRKQQTDKLIALDDEIAKRKKANDNEAFSSYSNIAEQTAKIQAQAREDFRKSVEDGLKEVQTLTKGWTEALTGLETRAHSDNPFVKQMLDNATATQKFKEEMRGLPADLKSVGYSLLQQANDLEIYKLKLDGAFLAIDLRNTAARFRDPTQKELQAGLNADEAGLGGAGRSTNPDVAYALRNRQLAINNLARDRARATLDQQLALDRSARTPQEQAEADAKTASAARSLDPDSLRADQRRDLADLFDRQALRAERRQDDAMKVQQDLLKIWQEIQKTGIKLANNVQAGGKNALQITLNDELQNGKVSRATASSEGDTDDFYKFDIVGGTNQ